CRALDGEAAADDQVKRIGGIVFVEDDLAALERSAPGDAEDAPDVLAGHPRQQLPLHGLDSTPLCRAFDISSVERASDRRAAPSYRGLTDSSRTNPKGARS